MQCKFAFDCQHIVPQLEQETLQAVIVKEAGIHSSGAAQFPTHAAQQIHLGVSFNEAVSTELSSQPVECRHDRPVGERQAPLNGEVHNTR